MKIINISTAIIKDEILFKEYVSKASVLMKEQNVEVVCRGKQVEGTDTVPHIMAIFRYDDRKAFDHFYTCEPYQKLVPLRNKACEMTIQVYSEL